MRAATFLFYAISGYVCYLTISVFYLSDTNAKKLPILLWWTDFVSGQETISCPNGHRCIVNGNKKDIDHPDLGALLFYGSNLQLDNLPSRFRNPNIPWALFHEESPKNLPGLRTLKLQRVFNVTSTFSRHSTFPITLQYLKNVELLTSTEYFVDVKVKNRFKRAKGNRKAAILYLQSDCGTPIGRDKYVKELMEYIQVDSFGACLNNKPLPQGLILNGTYELYASQLLKFSSRYKFIVSIENARCDDYITEKLWRPLIVGAIPIYLGSPTIKDWLPNAKSAILMDDFPTIKSMADYIKTIDNDDRLYNSFLNHKLKQQVTNPRLVEAFSLGNYGRRGSFDDVTPAFQCFVCDIVHSHTKMMAPLKNVYDCAQPEDDTWDYSWHLAAEQANHL